MTRAPGVVELSPAELRRLLGEGEERLVDVRESLERWFERIAGSDSAPLSSFDPATFVGSAGSVVFYCASGQRSAIAAARVAAASGCPVRHLGGGIHAWKSAGHAVERWGRAKPRAT